MSSDVRAEVVSRLVNVLTDDALSTDERIARVFNDDDATSEERFAAAQMLAHGSIAGLVEAGVLREATAPSVLDMTMRQLQSLAAIWGVVSTWDGSMRPERRLGDLVKILPAEHADEVVLLVRWGGLA